MLLPKSYFFIRTFLGVGIFWKQSLFSDSSSYRIYTSLTSIHSFKYTMVSFIVENRKQQINFNIGCVWLFRIIVISSENIPNESRSTCVQKCCNDDLLKIVKHWTTRHFWSGKELEMKFSKVIHIFIKTLDYGLDQLSLCSSKACKDMAYWFHG